MNPLVEALRVPRIAKLIMEHPGAWTAADEVGGRAFGKLENGIANIIGANAVPLAMTHTEAGEALKRRGFLGSLIRALGDAGASSVKMSLQSHEMQEAVKRLIAKGVLNNPREMAGISVAEYPTLMDIVK